MRLTSLLHPYIIYFLDLLFPHLCLGCGAEGEFFCAECARTLTYVPPSCVVCRTLTVEGKRKKWGRTCTPCRKKSAISRFFSPLRYEDARVRKILHMLKYLRMREGAFTAAQFLSFSFSRFKISFPEEALLLPIPLAKSRERTRGFNQSACIAEEFMRISRSALTLRPDILLRVRATRSQVGLSQDARKANMKGAFQITKEDLVRGKIAILLDDVKTTGATLEEAAKTLRAAGAREVWAITVAH
ncbi:MAG: phosphoribosyltransferase [Parcubacteria group bacterium Gr01-1014_33]|nr:MAG: phosphoribosyltransferase [Parcubacteria group bacterium Gr01-1014_33]